MTSPNASQAVASVAAEPRLAARIDRRASARPSWMWVHMLLIGGLVVAPFDLRIMAAIHARLGGFLAHEHPFHLVPYVTVQWASAALVVWALLGCLERAPRRFFISRAASARLVVGGALGVGLLLNVLAKSWWGRPRPKQLLEFGGTRAFRAVWNPDFGAHGTSFASGHSGAAALCIGLVWLVAEPRRARVLMLWLVPAWLWVALSRIASGGHFPSDVLIGSWLALAPLLAMERWLGPLHPVAPVEAPALPRDR
ncbi:MAG: phosphatase PAP2 family protein [Planctomycetota bacterium]